MEIWEGISQNYADRPKNLETDDPATEVRKYHNEMELYLAGSKQESRNPRLIGMGKSLLALFENTFLH